MNAECGCPCNCHEDEKKPEWPGPCEACCTPEWGPACDCSHGVARAWARRLVIYEELMKEKGISYEEITDSDY